MIGASGGIGRALVGELLAHSQVGCLIATSRSEAVLQDIVTEHDHDSRLRTCRVDTLDEARLAELALEVETAPFPLQLMLNATGVLSDGDRGPERRLEEANGPWLSRVFEVNAVGPLLVLKHLTERRYQRSNLIRRRQAWKWLDDSLYFSDFRTRSIELISDTFLALSQEDQTRLVQQNSRDSLLELVVRTNILTGESDPYLWHLQAQIAWEQSNPTEALYCQNRALSLLNQTKRHNRNRQQFEVRRELYEEAHDHESGSTSPTSSGQ